MHTMIAAHPSLRHYSDHLVAERPIYIDRPVLVDPAYPEFTVLEAELEAFDKKFDGIDVRHAFDPNNIVPHTARFDVATKNQMNARADAFGDLTRRGLMQILANEVPDLTDNIAVRVEGVRERVNDVSGEGFVHLTFDEESTKELTKDYDRAWEVLAEAGDAPVERFRPKLFFPDVRVAYIAGDMSERDRDWAMIKVVEMIDAAIDNEMYLLLGPVVDLERLKPRPASPVVH